MDLVNILARILDSEKNFNGSVDLMITVDHGFIQVMDPDFGFWLSEVRIMDLNVRAEILCAGCHAVEKMTRNSNALKRDGSVMADWGLLDFLSGSTDSAFSGSADIHTPIHPPLGRCEAP